MPIRASQKPLQCSLGLLWYDRSLKHPDTTQRPFTGILDREELKRTQEVLIDFSKAGNCSLRSNNSMRNWLYPIFQTRKMAEDCAWWPVLSPVPTPLPSPVEPGESPVEVWLGGFQTLTSCNVEPSVFREQIIQAGNLDCSAQAAAAGRPMVLILWRAIVRFSLWLHNAQQQLVLP